MGVISRYPMAAMAYSVGGAHFCTPPLCLLITLLILLSWGFAGFAEAAPKRIYTAPDDHTDYMWTADEATYKQAFLDMLDYYLDQADSTAGSPSEYQGRWATDGSFWMWTYEQNKTAAEFQRLINRIQDGHVSVPLNSLVCVYGGQPAEAVLRGMYYSGRIERKYNLRFQKADAQENQTLPYGLGSLWAGAGAKYSWKGICGCDTQIPNAWDRLYDVYRWAGPDGSSVIMKWNSMLVNNQGIGGYAEAYDPFGIVDFVDTNSSFIQRYPYPIIGAFGKGWDGLETFTTDFITSAQGKTNANRQVIVSNELDFFSDLEQNYGNTLPVQSVSYGNEWDLYSAAIVEQSAIMRRSVEGLRGAEALATLVSLKDPSLMAGRVAARDQAFMDIGLYWEHNIGSVFGAVSQSQRLAFQQRVAAETSNYVNTLQNDAVNSLGGMIQKSGSNTRFFVFNALSWTRSDFADLPYADPNPFHVVDISTGQEVPSQIVTVDGQRRLRILAGIVPPVGYKVFEIQAGLGAGFTDAASVSGSTIENNFFKVTVAANGAITSLIDKQRGSIEFERTINGRAMNDLGAGSGTLQVENAGPVSVTLLASASGPLVHTSRITLILDSDRIDIRNDINQNFNSTNTWAFGFNIDTPDVNHEEVGAIAHAKLDTQGGNYSSRAINARYDWLTLNHFVDVSIGNVGITLSNADVDFMQLGSSTVSSLDTTTPQISALAGGRVVNGTNGLPSQGGDTHFLQRFALKTHDAYDPAVSMRFALEHQNPFVTGVVTGGSAYPETSYSLVSISDPNVLLWALKPAEEGIEEGVIVRVWNVSPASRNFTLSFSDPSVTRAKQTSHIETDIQDELFAGNTLSSSIVGQQIKTYRLYTPTAPCSATLLPDLSLNVPIISYNEHYYWAKFVHIPNTLDFSLATAGMVSDTSPFNACSPSTLSPEFKLNIPSITFGGASYWADFQYAHDLIFALTRAGKN